MSETTIKRIRRQLRTVGYLQKKNNREVIDQEKSNFILDLNKKNAFFMFRRQLKHIENIKTFNIS